MRSGPDTTGNTKSSRKPFSAWELPLLLLFGFATLTMTADYVATEASPLRYLLGDTPWYITGLPWIGPVFVLVAWLALRRWLGAWAPFLAYMLFLYAVMGVVKVKTDQRLETIRLPGGLGSDEIEQLQSAVGERVYYTVATGRSPQLVIRRDQKVHERAVAWLTEHGR